MTVTVDGMLAVALTIQIGLTNMETFLVSVGSFIDN